MESERGNPPVISGKVRDAVTDWFVRQTPDEELDESFEDYRKYQLRKWLFIAACIVVTAVVAAYAVTVGGVRHHMGPYNG